MATTRKNQFRMTTHFGMVSEILSHSSFAMDRQHQETDVLVSISRLLATRGGQRETLAAVLTELEQRLGMLRGTILLLSADGTEMVVEVAPDAAAAPVRAMPHRSDEGLLGAVLSSGRPVLTPRASAEPRLANRIQQQPFRSADNVSVLCVPIFWGTKIIGALSVNLPVQSPDRLEEKSRLLEIVAGMIAYDAGARRTEAARRQALEAENLRLRTALEERFRPENILGGSPAMRDAAIRIRQAAQTISAVLIRGKSAAGKELVAAAIHYNSSRAGGPLVKVHCAAPGEGSFESELFGQDKGELAGPYCGRVGRIEEAEGGTIFFDEIGDLSPVVQVRLLRFLQEREFERVGGDRTLRANVRVVAATARNLEACVKAGTFRQDLYYCINVFPIDLPPTPSMSEAAEAAAPGSLTVQVQILEKDMLVDALQATRGNVAAAARRLGITPRMIRYKLKKLGIEGQGFFKRRR